MHLWQKTWSLPLRSFPKHGVRNRLTRATVKLLRLGSIRPLNGQVPICDAILHQLCCRNTRNPCPTQAAAQQLPCLSKAPFVCRPQPRNSGFSDRRRGIDHALSDPIHLAGFDLRQNCHFSIRVDRAADAAVRSFLPGSRISHLESQDDRATWSFWKK